MAGRTRLLEHVREGLPWALGATASCLYFVDAVRNEGQGAEAITSWFTGVSDGGKSGVVTVFNPALEFFESFEKDSLQHTDAERFLNKPMVDQVDCLVAWFAEKDYERALYYLAVFARDRGSPHTDWPVNPFIDRHDLIDHILEARQKGIVTAGLYNASLAALAQHPDNAQYILNEKHLGALTQSLKDSVESEADTALGLKTLALMAMHQPKSGVLEQLIVKHEGQNTLLPLLLTLLQDTTHQNVFEPRYVTQLLSCMIRTHPHLLREDLNGKYRDSEGEPISIYRAVREGVRFRDSFAVPYYIRLMRDCLQHDEEESIRAFNSVDMLSVLVGLLQNNWNYVEVAPNIVRAMLILNRATAEPAEILSYKDFLVVASAVVEKSGPFHHAMVQDLQSLIDEASMGVALPPSYIATKRPLLHRFQNSVAIALSREERPHVTKRWIESDTEKMLAARVSRA
eukprot:TRINITY_DN140_c0_g2_i1.p1 TRINITY_DN140_c0_g2~~TRINITY_DN140_c0_g2_i1.p1  ORF type:complete len:457 (+),score=165.11 TRINITY_DN140_c0_g2_i1:72-1442(+)